MTSTADARAAAHLDLVTTSAQLRYGGVSAAQLRRRLESGRWQRLGHAVVLHNGPLSPDQRRAVALAHAGPDAVLTAFTAAEIAGLADWSRTEVHLLAPAGTRLRRGCPVPVRLHRWRSVPERVPGRRVEATADALVRAAGSFPSPRPACGLLAAAVQQRVITVDLLGRALERASRVRHRAALRCAVADIAGGSEALSEIDFVRLCRRHGLPAPRRQTVRRGPDGRRRYLDASWKRADGRTVAVEIDGALHLDQRQWWRDQSRQNDLVLSEVVLLRFPSVVLRNDERVVVDQLRRALRL